MCVSVRWWWWWKWVGVWEEGKGDCPCSFGGGLLSFGAGGVVVLWCGGALVRSTLFGKLRICIYDISKKKLVFTKTQIVRLLVVALVSGGPSVVAGLVAIVLLAVVVDAFAFGGSCPCTLSCGSCLCLLWRGAAILRWVVLPSRPLVEWCCSLFSSLEVVLLPSLG